MSSLEVGVDETKAALAAGYDASIRKIKRWLLICAWVSLVAFVLWKVVTPVPPSGIQAGVSDLCALLCTLAACAAVALLVLWPIFADEKRKRLREVETRADEVPERGATH